MKTLALILLALTIAACGGNSQPAANNTGPNPVTAGAPTGAQVNEAIDKTRARLVGYVELERDRIPADSIRDDKGQIYPATPEAARAFHEKRRADAQKEIDAINRTVVVSGDKMRDWLRTNWSAPPVERERVLRMYFDAELNKLKK